MSSCKIARRYSRARMRSPMSVHVHARFRACKTLARWTCMCVHTQCSRSCRAFYWARAISNGHYQLACGSISANEMREKEGQRRERERESSVAVAVTIGFVNREFNSPDRTDMYLQRNRGNCGSSDAWSWDLGECLETHVYKLLTLGYFKCFMIRTYNDKHDLRELQSPPFYHRSIKSLRLWY